MPDKPAGPHTELTLYALTRIRDTTLRLGEVCPGSLDVLAADPEAAVLRLCRAADRFIEAADRAAAGRAEKPAPTSG